VKGLVLSVFEGIDILGMGFQDAGWCVVKGGDPIFGQRGVEWLHPPAGAFEGIIGGPPCQFAAVSHNLSGDKDKHENLIPEFERIVREAQPEWFLMENVTPAPLPHIEGYHIVDHKIYAWEMGNPQRRYRRFTFGSKPPVQIFWPSGAKPPRGEMTLLNNGDVPISVKYVNGKPGNVRTDMPKGFDTDKPSFTLEDYRYGFGLPDDWDAEVLLKGGKFKVMGNGVPLQVSRALANAVKMATQGVPA